MLEEEKAIQVLIVDDQPVVRQGLSTFLMAMEGLAVCGEASNGVNIVPLIEEIQPDVILMDLKMPECDGLTATSRILDAEPTARIIVLTSYHSDEMVQEALQAGALGYVLKNATAEEIAAAIRNAMARRRTLAPEATDALIRISQAPKPLGHDLTEREREVLAQLVEGLNNKQIANQLVISTATVKYHIGNILSKLEAANRVEAVSIALREGILSTE